MMLRSMLFVPGDSARKFAKAGDAGADALILDLEDSVAPARKLDARAQVSALLEDRNSRDWRFFVRVNPFDTGMTFDDMAAVVKPGLDGLMIPKADGAADVVRVAAELDRLEAAANMAAGSVSIVVRRHRDGGGDVQPWQLHAAASPPCRIDLGCRGSRRSDRGDGEQRG